MNRTTLSLIAAATALAAVTGFAAVSAPDSADTTATAKSPARLPVERSSLLCPAPSTSELAETAYTSFTPAGTDGAGTGGAAELAPSAAPLDDVAADDEKKDEQDDEKDGEQTGDTAEDDKAKEPAADAEVKPFLAVKEPGKPVSGTKNTSDAPALVGTATGRLAPGWTTQQTTTVTGGDGRGLFGTTCTPPDTDFWFPGASTDKARQDYVHLTNPDDTAAVADVALYGKEGTLKSDTGEGIPVPARSSVPVLLSTLTSEAQPDVTVHVSTRTGRVGAVVNAADEKLGGDWLAASADPAPSVVLPGIPSDATSVRLVVFAPGEDDAELKVRLAGKSGTIVPATAAETLNVKSGMTASLDLGDVTKGEAGSVLLGPAEGAGETPVVAALRVVRGKGTDQEVAFIPATGPVTERATAADNRAKGSTLSLAAPDGTGKVKVTASAGSGGGEQVVKTYTVKGGTTQAVTPPVPQGLKGSYALTVEPESGGPVHAARTLALTQDGVPMFTVQTMPDDRGMVSVPATKEDLSVLK
ncbi:hypothetical protein SSPS47_12135 [Streptomyces sp. S4.7]|uniref:DUF5719 family protein n=1 Tax=Streptomyces sp. S4.7 TaxID=2705439 RepID=UPI0013989B61|nr:DUF5719 family protein [Streptomyces sp. S4.7]QHY95866.1 hypothetical protein SSPS47_12135 [Streptomyces sp. S4.7]